MMRERKKNSEKMDQPWAYRGKKIVFYALLGTVSAKSSMTTRPAGSPPMVISKKTRGLDMML